MPKYPNFPPFRRRLIAIAATCAEAPGRSRNAAILNELRTSRIPLVNKSPDNPILSIVATMSDDQAFHRGVSVQHYDAAIGRAWRHYELNVRNFTSRNNKFKRHRRNKKKLKL